jgi:hypothetical protein
MRMRIKEKIEKVIKKEEDDVANQKLKKKLEAELLEKTLASDLIVPETKLNIFVDLPATTSPNLDVIL